MREISSTAGSHRYGFMWWLPVLTGKANENPAPLYEARG
jgi:hypothetical protein